MPTGNCPLTTDQIGEALRVHPKAASRKIVSAERLLAAAMREFRAATPNRTLEAIAGPLRTVATLRESLPEAFDQWLATLAEETVSRGPGSST